MDKTNTVSKAGVWKKRLMQNYSILVVILMIIVFTVLNPNFLNESNVVNLLSDSAPVSYTHLTLPTIA